MAEEIRLLERANSKSRKAQTQPKAARRGSTAQPMSAHEIRLQEEASALRARCTRARGASTRVYAMHDRALHARSRGEPREARATLDSQASAREEAVAIKARPKPSRPGRRPVSRPRPDAAEGVAAASDRERDGQESRASSLPSSPRGLPRVEPEERARADVVGGGWRPVGGKI